MKNDTPHVDPESVPSAFIVASCIVGAAAFIGFLYGRAASFDFKTVLALLLCGVAISVVTWLCTKDVYEQINGDTQHIDVKG